ncbi:MAG: B12-binding domain-containing radical SAM protein [Fervidobacterium sp.]|uniref:B12-binding domain-containing radical SAM protein n=1 Tax=Fervidobacterium sp. TaxID=1871331 RepID=UPI00404A24E2
MRRPRDSESFKEYNFVLNYRKSETEIFKLKGNLQKVALIFPNSYKIASGSLAWSWIQNLLSQKNINVQRFFYEDWFNKFYSLEEQIPIDEFSVWLFTFQFENDLINIAKMLKKKGIPLSFEQREPYHPIIIIGGPVTLFNHRIVEDIADFIFIGDLECCSRQFSDAISFESKEEIENSLLKIPQIYSKKYGKLKYENCIGNLSPIPVAHYITPHSPFKSKLLIEIGRGCIRRCAFCVTGYTKKPVKFAKLDDVIETLDRFKHHEFGLISATITDYPYLDELLDYIEDNRIRFSVSSIRIDKVNVKLLRLLRITDHHSFTVAPEGISQKMRDVMLKDLSTDQILRGLEMGRNAGFENVKFYYIIGLEEETEDDYRELIEFLSQVVKMGYKEVTVSINPLVPKLSTPFAGRRMIDKKEYEQRTMYIRKNVPKGVKLNFESYKSMKIQYEISHLKGNESIQYVQEKLEE